jgi:hypothetical protein
MSEERAALEYFAELLDGLPKQGERELFVDVAALRAVVDMARGASSLQKMQTSTAAAEDSQPRLFAEPKPSPKQEALL